MGKQPPQHGARLPAASPSITYETALHEQKARDRILDLLSDTETAKVSLAETAIRLDEGEEYVDLQNLAQGVMRADGVKTVMGRVLSRAAVRDKTWSAILAQLPSMSAPRNLEPLR